MPSRSSPSARPSTLISPVVGRRCPMTILMMVDFPAPFTPSRPKTVPLGTLRETFLTASNFPNLRPRFRVSMALSSRMLSKSGLMSHSCSGFRLAFSPAHGLGRARLRNLLQRALERVAQLALREPQVDALDQRLLKEFVQDPAPLALRHLDALPRDEGARALPLVDDALDLQIEVGARHRVRVDRQLDRELADGRQRVLRLEPPHRHGRLDLPGDLQVNRQAARRVDVYEQRFPRPPLYRSTNTVTQSTGRVKPKFQKKFRPPGNGRPKVTGRFLPAYLTVFTPLPGVPFPVAAGPSMPRRS